MAFHSSSESLGLNFFTDSSTWNFRLLNALNSPKRGRVYFNDHHRAAACYFSRHHRGVKEGLISDAGTGTVARLSSFFVRSEIVILPLYFQPL
jgi:hypothetical protein